MGGEKVKSLVMLGLFKLLAMPRVVRGQPAGDALLSLIRTNIFK
jgi:hypothetical protein